jgi:hypothetical protein
VNVTAWSQGLEVSGDGTGVVSHAGIGLLRHLADRTGLTGELSAALASGRLLKHDRGRVLADLACSIADGARVISDFRVMGDQGELFGPVASVPTAYRTLEEIADGGDRTAGKLTAALSRRGVSRGRRRCCGTGSCPGVRIADKTLDGVTCIRLDATVTFAHSDKELAEPDFKGFGHHPLMAFCDNTGGEPLSWMLRRPPPHRPGQPRPAQPNPDHHRHHPSQQLTRTPATRGERAAAGGERTAADAAGG